MNCCSCCGCGFARHHAIPGAGSRSLDSQPPPVTGFVYNALVIALAQTAMSIATWLFIVGICGSLIVILISFFEDLTELFGKE